MSLKIYNLVPLECWDSKMLTQALKTTIINRYSKNYLALNLNNHKNLELSLSFYINPNVDLQSILKSIVIISEAKSINFIEQPQLFNPCNISIDNLFTTYNTSSLIYNLENSFFGTIPFKIIPNNEDGFTRVCVKVNPLSFALAIHLIHYLGGHMFIPNKKTINYDSNVYKILKLSQTGRWKKGFTESQHNNILKNIFFKKMKPFNKELIIKLYSKENEQIFPEEIYNNLKDFIIKEDAKKNYSKINQKISQTVILKDDYREEPNFKI